MGVMFLQLLVAHRSLCTVPSAPSTPELAIPGTDSVGRLMEFSGFSGVLSVFEQC